jgi:hypothetical protein
MPWTGGNDGAHEAGAGLDDGVVRQLPPHGERVRRREQTRASFDRLFDVPLLRIANG